MRLPSTSTSMDTSKFIMPLRATQCVFTFVVLGMTAYVTNWWTNYWRDMSPAEINFLIFSSVWTIISLVYLVVAPMKFPALAHKLLLLGCDGLAMTFWFSGFVALAVFLSSRICFGNVCNVAKASVAFAAFEWLLFAATTLLQVLALFRSRGQSTANVKMVEDPPVMSTAGHSDGENFERVSVS